MAVVTVRAFGALRDLVGATVRIEADHVAGVLDRLRAEHGDEFDRRLARSTVAVHDEPVDHGDTAPLADGAEIVLLPPFAGG